MIYILFYYYYESIYEQNLTGMKFVQAHCQLVVTLYIYIEGLTNKMTIKRLIQKESA